MFYVYSDYNKSVNYFDNLKSAVKYASHIQREAFRHGIITTTTINQRNSRNYYIMHLPCECYRENGATQLSTKTADICLRRCGHSTASIVAFTASINSGFVNPFKIRNCGKKTIAELQHFSRQKVQTIEEREDATHLALF